MVDTTIVPLADTLNATWKNDKSGFGYRMLQKMGWKEEKGLGKNESGVTTHVKVKRREENAGLGVEKMSDEAGNRGWNATASSFNDVLLLLKQSYGQDDDNTKSGKKSKSKEKKEKDKNKKGSSAVVATISVGMKYKKLSAAKDLSTKSQEDLRSIFGTSMTPSMTSRTSAASLNSSLSSQSLQTHDVERGGRSKKKMRTAEKGDGDKASECGSEDTWGLVDCSEEEAMEPEELPDQDAEETPKKDKKTDRKKDNKKKRKRREDE